MKTFFRLVVSVASLFICLLLAELFLEVFAPVPDPFEQLKYVQPVNHYIRSEYPPNFSLTTEPEAGLPGVHGRNRFSTNNMGFRGDDLTVPKPKDEFRIFIVGGSTTECLYIDDAKALNRVVQEQLQGHVPVGVNVKVYGAGKAGDASDDHVSMIVHRLVHLEPDMIILFAGVNDLTRAIYRYDYLHYDYRYEGWEEAKTKLPLWKLLATEFQLPRRILILKHRLAPNEREVLEAITAKSAYQEKVRLRAAAARTDVRPRLELDAYANNLRTMIGVAQAHKIQLVFMTQQSTWNSAVDPNAQSWHWMLYRARVTYREDFMDEALEALNEQMRRLDAENAIPLYDIAKAMPKSHEFFYDHVHFNERDA